MRTKNFITGLVASIIGMSQTAQGSTEDVPTKNYQAATCDEENRLIVLRESNPIFTYCPSERELQSEEIDRCQKLVACMLEENIIVDSDTIAKFVGPGGSTHDGSIQAMF